MAPGRSLSLTSVPISPDPSRFINYCYRALGCISFDLSKMFKTVAVVNFSN